jgi:hypothetical protein
MGEREQIERDRLGRPASQADASNRSARRFVLFSWFRGFVVRGFVVRGSWFVVRGFVVAFSLT